VAADAYERQVLAAGDGPDLAVAGGAGGTCDQAHHLAGGLPFTAYDAGLGARIHLHAVIGVASGLPDAAEDVLLEGPPGAGVGVPADEADRLVVPAHPVQLVILPV
jgi:hypothetical protein